MTEAVRKGRLFCYSQAKEQRPLFFPTLFSAKVRPADTSAATLGAGLGNLWGLIGAAGQRRPPSNRPYQGSERPVPREMRVPAPQPGRPSPEIIVRGRCWVIDGDTIVIGTQHIRLAGIDAPELDHPWGQQSKWAMVKLCKGQTITARIKPEVSYDRVVAECFLPDGRDLAAELVKAGLALDWPKFSGGKYRSLEPDGVRSRLWRASLRQGGQMWPTKDVVSVPRTYMVPTPRQPEAVTPTRTGYRIVWLMAAGVLMLMAGCNLVGGRMEVAAPETARQQQPAIATLAVTADVLNVRASPRAGAEIIAQLVRGTVITPGHLSGGWYGFELPNGGTGWVHGSFLRRTEQQRP